jgi:spore germination protein
MEIYIVQQGDTIRSIADKFGISLSKLITDNGLVAPYNLVVGQTIVIAYPKQIYVVQEGDTLEGIADAHDIPVMQLLRNNPELSNRAFIYPGETITISYENNKGKLGVIGVAYPFIREEILRKTLPYLTYLTIFNYRVDKNGIIIERDDDTSIIQIAKAYQVAPLMLLTTLSAQGMPSAEAAYAILLDPIVQERYVENILSILRKKGFYGIDVTFLYVNISNLSLYINFVTFLSNRLHPEGFRVFITINPVLEYSQGEITFEKVDYSLLGQIADNTTFLSYDWGYSLGPPAQVSVITTDAFLDYIVTIMPLEKTGIGLPTLGYNWELPFVAGFSRANSLNFDSAIALAYQVNAEIQYDESTLSAYYYYNETNEIASPVEHLVWFKDARSVNSSIDKMNKYGIYNTAIWNIMYYFSQMWVVINSQYEIEKINNDDVLL